MSTKTNRLAKESSPYLRQHGTNPVDWYPWGQEALDRARRDGKLVFLSIGYSACHWCHVMERESFEDLSTAEILNRDFISIKVDREERPDLDLIYMSAVQAMTQRGGWPLNVFLTPDLKPFYGGTYFPPTDRPGMPSFKRVLAGVAGAWKSKKEEVTLTANQLTDAISDFQTGGVGAPPVSPTLELIDAAVGAIAQSFDSAYGGLGSAPKFFHCMSLRLCLRQWARTADATALRLVTFTLDHLARGGIRDQLGGGFHRYSTDAQWLAPHFEKMLYDNALLAELFLEAYQATGNAAAADVARSTLDYVLREMGSPEGGFYSTQDADSEGVEGKFYVWSHQEVLSILGEELGTLFAQVYDVTPAGNWEGQNILRLKTSIKECAQKLELEESVLEDELSVARRKLMSERSKRIWPDRDEKILLSWNALMLHSLALAHQSLDDTKYLEAALKVAKFLKEDFVSPSPLPSGKLRLLHSRKDGKTRFNGYLDDYAFFLNGVLTLYGSDFDPQWIAFGVQIAESLLEQFWSPEQQCFFFTGKDHEALISRPREFQDGATPAGQSMAVTALLRLARFTGISRFEDIARAALNTSEPHLRLIPTAMSQMVIGLLWSLESSKEAALFPGNKAEEFEELLKEIRRTFIPNLILCCPPQATHGTSGTPVKLLEGRAAIGNSPTLFACENYVCDAPAVGTEKILEEIRKWKPALN